jgi:hypothetical protein
VVWTGNVACPQTDDRDANTPDPGRSCGLAQTVPQDISAITHIFGRATIPEDHAQRALSTERRGAVDRVAARLIHIGETTMTVDEALMYAEYKLGLTADDAHDFLEMVLDSEDFQDFQQMLQDVKTYAKSVKAAA